MPPTALELCRLTACELSELLEKRDASPVEIVGALLERIVEIDSKINAFICADPERVRAEARDAEREMMADGRKSPLHGIPIAHKDVFDARGYATTAGSRVQSWERKERDSAVIARLRNAGAIVLGKTNTTEFAAGTMEVFGETRNPWDLCLTTGTSSAGSAAAVAACMAPLATGSDTGGSIRIPAAYCGIAGLKPTFDTTMQGGMAPFSPSFDSPGVMARSVTDIALFMNISIDSFSPTLDGIRIGVPRKYFFEGLDPDVERSVDQALDGLRRLGAQLVSVEVPHITRTGTAFWAIAYRDALECHRRDVMVRHADFTKPLLYRLLAAACLTEDEVRRAHEARDRISSELNDALANVDALVTPTAPTPATPIGAKLAHLDRNRFTRPANLAGVPALSIPCGFSSAGLPIGLQLVSRQHAETTLLRVAVAYERSTDWHRRVVPDVILDVGARSASEPNDSDNALPGEKTVSSTMRSLHQQGFDFVDEEMAAEAALVLETSGVRFEVH